MVSYGPGRGGEERREQRREGNGQGGTGRGEEQWRGADDSTWQVRIGGWRTTYARFGHRTARTQLSAAAAAASAG